ncbi:MAG: TlyA family RNA methyltransferase [Clostridiales bacterium]|nr:TlyA family RNA methyltransferase [Clostridiales bacterium]
MAERADKALVKAGLAEDLTKASALIMEGRALYGTQKILKPSEKVREISLLRLKGDMDAWVSRGAHKLEKAFEVFDISARDKVCADIGASTGGFTQVLLSRGAKRVYAVDVGYNLLAWKLRSDERVRVMERTNARLLKPGDIPETLDMGVTDVSFISLKAIIPPVLRLLAPGADFVALIKPQFEANREEVGEKGVVRDPQTHIRVISDIVSFCENEGYSPAALDFSPITGQEGNIEFLLHLKNRPGVSGVSEETIQRAVSEAHVKFGI